MVLEAHDAVGVALRSVSLDSDVPDLKPTFAGELTFKVFVLHLPFLQFLSTNNLSQYTVFQGLVNLTSLVKVPLAEVSSTTSDSESLPPSTLLFFPMATGEVGADLLLDKLPRTGKAAGSHSLDP